MNISELCVLNLQILTLLVVRFIDHNSCGPLATRKSCNVQWIPWMAMDGNGWQWMAMDGNGWQWHQWMGNYCQFFCSRTLEFIGYCKLRWLTVTSKSLPVDWAISTVNLLSNIKKTSGTFRNSLAMFERGVFVGEAWPIEQVPKASPRHCCIARKSSRDKTHETMVS